MLILNIHGYGGTAHNTAYDVLNELYPGRIISPQFDYDRTTPDNVISLLEQQIKRPAENYGTAGLKSNKPTIGSPLLAEVENEKVGAIVGTSFGGFFACCVGRRLEIPIILVNPCLLPFITFRQFSVPYDFARYGRQLYELFGRHMGALDQRYLSTIVGTSDELIDHAATTAYLARSKRWFEIESGHQIGRADELAAAFRNIFSYYEENLAKIQEGETLSLMD